MSLWSAAPSAWMDAAKAALTQSINFGIEADPALHDICRGLAGRRLRLRPEFLAMGEIDVAFAADGLLDSLEPGAEPDLVLVLTKPSRDGLRIEGNALLAERLAPLSSLISARAEELQARLMSVPWVSRAAAGLQASLRSGEWVLTQAQFDDTAARLRRLREGLDRVERRLSSFSA